MQEQAPEPVPPDVPTGAPDPHAEGFFDALSSLDAHQAFEIATSYGLPAIKALVLAALGWLLAGWVRRVLRSSMERARFDLTLTKFFSNLARWAVLGVETTSAAAVIAAAGLAVGLALQGSLANGAAGIMILVFRPFRVGDIVTVGGVTGQVDEIELFTTSIDTADRRRFIVPNGSVFGSTIENLTFHPRRRVEVLVGVSYSADLDLTRRTLLEAARSVPGTSPGEEPSVLLDALGASAVEWKVRVWCPSRDFFAVRDAATRAVKQALDRAGLSIPFPQMDVHLRKVGD
jgi:small conductance mechanosensitive channel